LHISWKVNYKLDEVAIWKGEGFNPLQIYNQISLYLYNVFVYTKFN
jgi:hypothetical protein